LRILNRAGSEFALGHGELGAVQLRLVGIDPHPVLQVSQMRRGRLPAIDRVAQGLQERSLPGRIAVGVLGQQPRRLGAVLTDQRPPRPALGVQNLPEPPRVVLVDAVPLRRQLVREPERVLPRGRGHRGADPLILILPG
jgi:hypothetical protein